MKYTNYKHDGRAVPFVVKNGGLQFMSGYSWFAKIALLYQFLPFLYRLIKLFLCLRQQ